MKQYEIIDGMWSGKIVESDELLTGFTRKHVPDESKNYVFVGNRWVETSTTLDQKRLDKELADALVDLVDKRNQELNSHTVTVGDYTFDARPKDRDNLKEGIARGTSKWITVDHQVVNVTPAVLTQVLNEGIAGCEAIWDDHKQRVLELYQLDQEFDTSVAQKTILQKIKGLWSSLSNLLRRT